MILGSGMTDKHRHRCTRCEQVGRHVEWQPLLGEFMHYECWLELAWETMKSHKVPSKPRPERIVDALQVWFDFEMPEQTELF